MFGLFKKSLSSYQAPTIQTVLFAQATRHLNKALAEEASSLGQPRLFDKIDRINYLSLLELYYSYLFGRMIARLNNNNRDIPQPPNLIGQAYRMRDAIIALLIWSEDPSFINLKANSVGRKALEIGSAMSEGMDYVVNAPFRLHFGACLDACGYPDKSIERLVEIYSTNLDIVIDEICQEADSLWDNIPRHEKNFALEELAATAQRTILEINSNSHFSIFLERL